MSLFSYPQCKGNRNKIAHGESVALSLNSLTDYYKNALKVVVLLQRTCGL